MTDGPPQQFHDRRRDGVAPDGGAVVHEVGTSISWMCRNTRKTPAIRFAATIQLDRSEEHTTELQSLMRISYAVVCLTKKNQTRRHTNRTLTYQIGRPT